MRRTLFTMAAAGLLVVTACGPEKGPLDPNNRAAVASAKSSANTTASTTTANAGATIEAREPDRYSATMVATLAASGQQQARGQTEISVARDGADRRYSVTLPSVGELVLLDKGDKRYLILPARRQYAELTQELRGVGIEQLRWMTPGQIVAFVTRQQGIERVGEETLNARPVVKYRAASHAQTQSSAGQVQGESFIYVDKETGLPLRVEGFSAASGNVQGVSGGNVIIEMRNLRTDVNPADFELPSGYNKLTAEQLRQQTPQLAQFLQGT